jgi:two-component system sensor histidine kinase PilS (NtrC family)
MAVRIGELLLKEERITAAQLQEALDRQKEQGGKLGYNLVQLGLVEDDEIASILSKQYGVPSINLAQFDIDASVIKLVPAATAQKYEIVPVSRDGATLTIAMSDPTNVFAVDDIKFMTGYQAAGQITGYAVADVFGRPIFDLLHLPLKFEKLLAAAVTGSHRLDLPFDRPDGRKIDLGLNAAPLNTPGGQAGFLIVFQDVTETKRLQRKSAVQKRLAAVGEMAAGIAHEVRNPLASMSGSIQILRQEIPLNAEQRQLMDIVVRESERLNETIKSFLAYARPQRVSTRRFDFRRAVNDTALLLQHSPESADAHHIQVDVPSTPVWFDADEGQMRQVVWNLATNGIRAMPDGGNLVVGVQFEEPSSVALRVRDAGVGIPADELDSMLEPFHGRFAQGTGLGLAIVHRIVSDHGGELHVTSAPGAGTTVCVRLPVPAAAAASGT